VVNKLRGGLKVSAVKAPASAIAAKAMLEDIAILTAGQLISETSASSLRTSLSTCWAAPKKVIIDKERHDRRWSGQEERDRARVGQIKAQIEETTSDYDKEKLQERLAKLAGGVAVIRVGGATEVEVKEKKDRVEDALNATRAAVEEASCQARRCAVARQEGGRPYHQRQLRRSGWHQHRAQGAGGPDPSDRENAGVEGSIVVGKIAENKSETFGFDAQTRSMSTCRQGIIDPAKVVRAALQDAASVAGLLVTTEAMVAEMPKEAGADAPDAARRRRHGRNGFLIHPENF